MTPDQTTRARGFREFAALALLATCAAAALLWLTRAEKPVATSHEMAAIRRAATLTPDESPVIGPVAPPHHAKVPSADRAATPAPVRILQWGERGPITKTQADLVRLYRKLPEVQREMPDAIAELQAFIAKLEADLGEDRVRSALPGEIVMVPRERTNLVRAHNPSSDNLVFHVAIDGELQWMGSMPGSVTHEVWLRPGEAIDIPTPSRTSPATTYR